MNGINIAHMKPTSDWEYEFSLMASWGVKGIRFRADDFIENMEIKSLLKCMSVAFEYDISIIMTLPSKSLYPNYTSYTTENNLMQWAKVMQVLNNNPAIIGYEIMNEPNHLKGAEWDEHLPLIINTLRQFTYAPIVINSGTGMFRFTKPVQGKHIHYSNNDYEPFSYTHNGVNMGVVEKTYPGMTAWDNMSSSNRIWNYQGIKDSLQTLRDFQLKYNANIFVGEFSVQATRGGSLGDTEFLEDHIKIYNEYDWDWYYWGHTVREDRNNEMIFDAVGERLEMLKGYWDD